MACGSSCATALAAALAITAAIVVMLFARNDLLAVITGMAVAAAARAVGW